MYANTGILGYTFRDQNWPFCTILHERRHGSGRLIRLLGGQSSLSHVNDFRYCRVQINMIRFMQTTLLWGL